MSTNKSSIRAARTGKTTIIPVGAMPRTKAGFFGGEGLGPPGVLFCLLFCAAAAAILDFGVVPPPYIVGARSPIDFYARASFTYKDSDELNTLREEAAIRAPRVYIEDEQWDEIILSDLAGLIIIVENSSTESEARDKMTVARMNYSSLLTEMFKRKGSALTRAITTIREAMRKQFIESAILSEEDYKKESNKREPRKLIRFGTRGGKPYSIDVLAKDYKRLSAAQDDIVNSGKHTIDTALQWQLSAYLEAKMRPGLVFDEARTEVRQREELARVGDGAVRVSLGDPILKKTLIVRPATLEKLRQEYRAVKAGTPMFERLRRLGGLAALAAGIVFVFFIVAGRIEPGIWERRRALVMLGLLSLAALAVCRALSVAGISLAFAPFVFVGMAASLAFSESVALLTLLGL